jgi:hypothetical protein
MKIIIYFRPETVTKHRQNNRQNVTKRGEKMNAKLQRLEEIEKNGKKGRGKTEYMKMLNGEKISAAQALKAKCYDCSGWYADGTEDCKIENCALYPFMPYNENRVKKTRVLTDAQRSDMGKRLKAVRDRA